MAKWSKQEEVHLASLDAIGMPASLMVRALRGLHSQNIWRTTLAIHTCDLYSLKSSFGVGKKALTHPTFHKGSDLMALYTSFIM